MFLLIEGNFEKDNVIVEKYKDNFYTSNFPYKKFSKIEYKKSKGFFPPLGKDLKESRSVIICEDMFAKILDLATFFEPYYNEIKGQEFNNRLNKSLMIINNKFENNPNKEMIYDNFCKKFSFIFPITGSLIADIPFLTKQTKSRYNKMLSSDKIDFLLDYMNEHIIKKGIRIKDAKRVLLFLSIYFEDGSIEFLYEELIKVQDDKYYKPIWKKREY